MTAITHCTYVKYKHTYLVKILVVVLEVLPLLVELGIFVQLHAHRLGVRSERPFVCSNLHKMRCFSITEVG